MFGNNNNESFKGGAPTYVGKGMRIEGKIWGKRPIWIDGEVKGTIDIGSEVVYWNRHVINGRNRRYNKMFANRRSS